MHDGVRESSGAAGRRVRGPVRRTVADRLADRQRADPGYAVTVAPMTFISKRARLLAVAAAATLALAACGSGDTEGQDAPGPATTTGAAPAATQPADDCGGVAEKIRSQGLAGVDTVEVVGQCTTVTIATTLGDADGAAAKEICEKAAEVAYEGDINSIRVVSGSGAELSQGLKGVPCLG